MKRILVPVLSLSAVMLILMAGASALSPVLPQYARDFGVSLTIVGFVLATNNAVRMLAGFPAGVAADRWGRKPLIVIGMLITGAGAFIAWSVARIEVLFIGQALIGLGTALYATAALSMVVDLADETQRSKTTGLYMMGYHLGTVFGPSVGGALAFRFGLGSPFLLFAILAVMAAFAAVFLTRETHVAMAPTRERSQPQISWTHGLSRHLNVVYYINFAFRFGFNGLMWTTLPLLIADWGLDSLITGLVFTVLGVCSLLVFFPSGILADKIGRRSVMLPAAVVAALSFVFLAWANTLPLLIAACVVLGISSGCMATIPAAWVGDLAPAEIRGTALGFYRSFGDLGLALSPAVMGFVGEHLGLSATFYVGFALWTIATVGIAWLPDRMILVAQKPAQSAIPHLIGE